ncbi:MAG TPA: hypothetical protein VE174_12300 [Actinomycetota bacterium]|nr:hypothetical protein [Actinomycetota bacterium]
MTQPKAISLALSGAILVLALSVGGGVPLSPARIADATSRAAENSAVAARNTERAANDTEALATIARNVRSQVETSRKLLETQTGLHNSSKLGAARSEEIANGIASIQRALNGLRTKIQGLTRSSSQAAGFAERSSDAAEGLAITLRALRDRFDTVVKESRKLNRKARGYSELRDGPG